MDSIIERENVKDDDKWNVNLMYSETKDWESDMQRTHEDPIFFPLTQFLSLKGRLHEGEDIVHNALELYFSIMRKVEKIYVYAHLRHDEDINNDQNKTYLGHALSLYYSTIEQVAWFRPDILNLDKDILTHYTQIEKLKEYHFFLQDLLRQKKHTLSSKEEELIAQSAKALSSSSKTFRALNDGDFDFGDVLDENDHPHRLTNGSYSLFLTSKDRVLRKNAYMTLHKHYQKFQNTLCETLQGSVTGQHFSSKVHHFESDLECALFDHNIDTSVYHTLISTIKKGFPLLQRYAKIKKKILKVNNLHLYDLYVPLGEVPSKRYSFNEAVELCVKAVEPLGENYQQTLKEGLVDKRWVDRYENKNKRSGAYSSGCYDSEPYILMNFKGKLRDVFILAHEAGHSMHSLLSHKKQPYHYADYSIFVAEIASTFNEDLLRRELLKQCLNPQEEIYLLSQTLEDIRATLFRQTLFAEFELYVHQEVEKGKPLTPTSLNTAFLDLCKEYYAPEIIIDSLNEVEWARIPHFYSRFYVYQYATGISAALALVQKMLNEGEPVRKKYLNFLSSGGSKYPLELLEETGIDMKKPDVIELAINSFDQYLTRLENLI